MGSVALVGLTIVGILIGRAGPRPHLLTCSALYSVCWPFWSAGPVLGQLALAAKRARSGAGSPMDEAKSLLGCLTSWMSWDWVGACWWAGKPSALIRQREDSKLVLVSTSVFVVE